MDRGGSSAPVSDYDRLTTTPSPSIVASQFPAEQYNACPKPMMGLNYDWSAMSTLVDSMVPNGGTNQPIGLVWGWQTLVGGGPFTAPAFDANYKYQQIIILLSDGLNTQDRWYGNGSSISTSVDYRMYDTNGNGTCANIKAAGITIYTIQVNTGSDPTSTLLRNCATDGYRSLLYADVGGPDRHDVQHHRHQPDQAAGGPVDACPQNPEPPRKTGVPAFMLQPSINDVK